MGISMLPASVYSVTCRPMEWRTDEISYELSGVCPALIKKYIDIFVVTCRS